MDALDHKKHTVSTGHEVHLCHRCGWPFPNPHPSSRHRRAHKRICGTIKGYEIDQSKSAVSDDSDDDEHNPSPMVEKANSKEVVSSRIGGVGKISNKSEEDVFSDAITEFSDGGISPQTGNKSIERDFNSSQSKVVDENVVSNLASTKDRTEQLNDPTNIDRTYNSGAMVNAMDHFEGDALITDTKLKPVSVGHYNGLQPDIDEVGGDKGTEQELVKTKEEANTQKEEGKLVSSTLDCEEEKTLDPALIEAERKNLVAEVVKHESSGQNDTFEEMDATKEVKEVSDSIECSDVVPVDSFIEKEGDKVSFDPNVEETFAHEQVKTEILNGGSENGKEVATLLQERHDSAMQSDHSTEIPSDLYSNAINLEEVSKLESSLLASRVNGIEVPPKESDSETPCDIKVKNGVEEVEPVGVTGIVSELKHNGDISELGRTLEQNGSEILTETSEIENSIEPKHDDNENSEISSLRVQESSIEECSKENLPSVEEHNTDDNALMSENFSFTPILDKSIASPLDFQVMHESSTAGGENVSVDCKDLKDEGGDVNMTTENDGVSVIDHSTTKSDSQEGKCGSVSAVPETTLMADKSETNSQEPKTTTDKLDVFEPPSFMTLVNHASEIETVQQTAQHTKSDTLQAGWFPSLTNVVNESEGRKKNEEKIAKVTKHHIPLKNLLSEAKSPNTKQIPSTYQKEEDSVKENGADVMKVNSAVDVEASKEMDKEWDSPAKYPIENKKEKKKKKGFWLPFACCSSSVHRDL